MYTDIILKSIRDSGNKQIRNINRKGDRKKRKKAVYRRLKYKEQ